MNLSEKSATSRVHANPSAQAQPPFSPRPGRHEARCLDHRGRNGKPAPDIFLFAAARLKARPEDCIVIEDSPGGIRAARAAGMTAIGLHAAGHLPAGHGRKLLDAGAHHIAKDWNAARAVIAALL